jgi:hypothetical protein
MGQLRCTFWANLTPFSLQWGPEGTDNWTVDRNAYAKGKLDTEVAANAWGAAHGVDVVS